MAEPATKTSLAALRTAADSGPVVTASFTDSAGWALIQRVANALAQSTLVPQQFQANIPNCIICLEMAQRIGASPEPGGAKPSRKFRSSAPAWSASRRARPQSAEHEGGCTVMWDSRLRMVGVSG